MKKKNLSLKKLKITSFVTQIPKPVTDNLLGGSNSQSCNTQCPTIDGECERTISGVEPIC